MAGRGGKKRARSAGALDTVWPPPPACAPVEAGPPRRLLLPLYMALPQMPKGFGLPGWARFAMGCIAVAFMALLLELHAPIIGKIMVGLFVFGYSAIFLCLLVCECIVLGVHVARGLGKTTVTLPTEYRSDILSALDGWMGTVPHLMFCVWGLFYLAGDHIHLINRVALAVWGGWFLLGCVVAVVNGVGQWLRDRRTSRGVEP